MLYIFVMIFMNKFDIRIIIGDSINMICKCQEPNLSSKKRLLICQDPNLNSLVIL